MEEGYREVIGSRSFKLLWLGQTTSQFGNAFHELALIWLALQLAGVSLSSIGLVIFARFIPYLFFGLIGGVCSDRWNRKRTMIVTDILRGLVVLLLPLLDMAGVLALWHLAVVAFIMTSLRTFFQPSLQASVPQVVAEKQLVAANGLLQASLQAAEVLGPIAAGFLFAALSPRILFLFDSTTFFISALTIALIALPHTTPGRQAAQPNVLQDIVSTIRLLRGAPVVFWTILFFAIEIFVIAGILRLGLPAFTEQILRGGPQVYGLLMGVMGMGTVIGCLLVGRLRRVRYDVLIFLGWICYGLFLGLIGASAWLPLVLLFATLTGGAAAILNVMLVSMIQLSVPQQQLGKVFSFFSTLANLSESLSGLLIGAMLGLFQSALVLIGSGIVTVAIGIVGLLQNRLISTNTGSQSSRIETLELAEHHVS
jgi:MFS transporter, DHA3 family, macrolide efflux protein